METSALTPLELKRAFEEGRNLMQLLRSRSTSAQNDEKIIELSYDLQAGSYTRNLESPGVRETTEFRTGQIAKLLHSLGPCSSFLEAGSGEATTLWHVLKQMPVVPEHLHGFDLCWSRVAYAQRWLERLTPRFQVQLTSASLMKPPYAANSFDTVLTCHAIEPNHGREVEILTALYEVASRYLVLLEPAYELCEPEARARMEAHGYCRGLAQSATALGMKVVRHEVFSGTVASWNPTALIVIEKNPNALPATPVFACPAMQTPLVKRNDCFYSPQSMRAYPVIGGVPVLRAEFGVVASKLEDLL